MELINKEDIKELDGKIVRFKRINFDGEDVLIAIDLLAKEGEENIYFFK